MSNGRGFITAVDLLLYNQRGEGNLPLARLAVERENGPAHSGVQLLDRKAERKGSHPSKNLGVPPESENANIKVG